MQFDVPPESERYGLYVRLLLRLGYNLNAMHDFSDLVVCDYDNKEYQVAISDVITVQSLIVNTPTEPILHRTYYRRS